MSRGQVVDITRKHSESIMMATSKGATKLPVEREGKKE